MIAANLRKHPDAMLRQMELDLAGVVGAPEGQRKAFWTWIMKTATVTIRKVTAPNWWKEMKTRAVALARAVKAACMHLAL